MALFLILAMPLWLLIVVSFYPVPSRGWRGLLLPFLGGLVCGMIAITITLGLLTRNPFSLDPGAAYAWAWYRGPGWMMTVVTVFLGIFYHLRPTAYSRIRELACWMAGAAFVYTFWYGVSPEPGFDGYRLFLAPFFWMGSVGTVVWCLDRGLRSDGWLQWFLYGLSVLLPSLFTFIPVLHILGPLPVSWLLAVFLTAGSGVLIYLDSRGLFS